VETDSGRPPHRSEHALLTHSAPRGGYFTDRQEIQRFRRYLCAPMLEAVLVLAATVANLFRPRWSL
jgi:hypothetical protein